MFIQVLDLVHMIVTSVVMMVIVFDHPLFVTDIITVEMDLMKLIVVSNYTHLHNTYLQLAKLDIIIHLNIYVTGRTKTGHICT